MSRRRGTSTHLTRNPKEHSRGYSLGERNPDTLPSGSVTGETWNENRLRTGNWSRIRKWIASVNATGAKY